MTNKIATLYDGTVTVEFNEAEHSYYVTREDRKPFRPTGVTAPLGRLNKPKLMPWAAKMCSEATYRDLKANYSKGGEVRITLAELEAVCRNAKAAHRTFTRDAADVGTIVHKFAEDWLKGEKPPLPSDKKARNGAEAFLAWAEDNQLDPIHVERIVFSKRWGYSGTCDFDGYFNGTRCVLDFKTSKPGGPYLEHPLQLAGYQIAISEETGDEIDMGYIVRLDKSTGVPEVYELPITNLHRDAYTYLVELHNRLTKIERELDGYRSRKTANAA